MKHVCGILHSESAPSVIDQNGCHLEVGHSGPHEFIDQNEIVYQWETDLTCDCEYCSSPDNGGDYCTIYWRKQYQDELDKELRKTSFKL